LELFKEKALEQSPGLGIISWTDLDCFSLCAGGRCYVLGLRCCLFPWRVWQRAPAGDTYNTYTCGNNSSSLSSFY